MTKGPDGERVDDRHAGEGGSEPLPGRWTSLTGTTTAQLGIAAMEWRSP